MNDIDLISQLYVFRSVPRTEIEALVRLAPPQLFEPHERVFVQGEVANVALLLVDGRLEATVEAGGMIRRVGEVGPGEIVGEQALFHPLARRSATVSATQLSRGLIISRDLLEQSADNLAMVALETYLMGALARRIRSTNRTLMQAWKESKPKQTGSMAGRPPPPKAGSSSLLDNLRRLFGGE